MIAATSSATLGGVRSAVQALPMLHAALAERGIPIIHTFIYTAPDWYVDGIKAAIAWTPSYGNTVVVADRLPASFEDQVWNEHSGGHYTPELNRQWGEELYDLLRDKVDGLIDG